MAGVQGMLSGTVAGLLVTVVIGGAISTLAPPPRSLTPPAVPAAAEPAPELGDKGGDRAVAEVMPAEPGAALPASLPAGPAALPTPSAEAAGVRADAAQGGPAPKAMPLPATQPASPSRLAEMLAPIIDGAEMSALPSAPQARAEPVADPVLNLDPARASLPKLDAKAPTLLQAAKAAEGVKPSVPNSDPVDGDAAPGLLTPPVAADVPVAVSDVAQTGIADAAVPQVIASATAADSPAPMAPSGQAVALAAGVAGMPGESRPDPAIGPVANPGRVATGVLATGVLATGVLATGSPGVATATGAGPDGALPEAPQQVLAMAADAAAGLPVLPNRDQAHGAVADPGLVAQGAPEVVSEAPVVSVAEGRVDGSPPKAPDPALVLLAGEAAELSVEDGTDQAPGAVESPVAAVAPSADLPGQEPGGDLAAGGGAEQAGSAQEPGADVLAEAVPAAPPTRPVVRQPGGAKAGFGSAENAGLPGRRGEAQGVKLAQLPQIGVEKAEVETAEVADAADLPPIERFAAPFINPGDKPLFAIILVDDGTMDMGVLADLPLPFTVALDPAWAGAGPAEAAWRAAGREVLALATALPEGAQASDVEVTFQSHAASLPEAVGVMDLPRGGFQDDRQLSEQVVGMLAAEGKGLVTFERGLNPAAQVAARAGVRQAVIFRELDGEGEGAPKIRRYLDRAAFKAAQVGSVVVVGRMRPETIQALVEWAAEGRAGTVNLAPASAVMVVQ